jgi:hypothetical protein
MSPLRRLAAVPAAVVASVLLAGSALAAQPIHNVFDVDDTIMFTETSCGFPISRTVQGTVRETIMTDADGNLQQDAELAAPPTVEPSVGARTSHRAGNGPIFGAPRPRAYECAAYRIEACD